MEKTKNIVGTGSYISFSDAVKCTIGLGNALPKKITFTLEEIANGYLIKYNGEIHCYKEIANALNYIQRLFKD